MISFAAGQAAFTLVVIILFNIIQPVGWKVGLTRIEDVAIGCGVSIVVGILFWPRGATAALGRALSAAFVASSAYLTDAVGRLTVTQPALRHRCQPAGLTPRLPHFDDAFRQFFAERGAKVVSVETISRLFTGSNRLRLAAFTLATFPVRPPDAGQTEVESVAVAEAVLRDSYAASAPLVRELRRHAVRSQRERRRTVPHGAVLHDVLRRAFEDVREQQRADRVQTTLQMLWADELLETQNQMQVDLRSSADLFVRGKRRGRLI